eukprot:TRINITY_DN56123_c0_g1_i1.p1 TRINITY_DN56123_c0_g1~~TRINITY_DN56123_c0_g1_i1.p1  ORF type:complete len:466 (-),score=50.98 TRINITY_DN56123_c0_g1_i1:324-1664(-)
MVTTNLDLPPSDVAQRAKRNVIGVVLSIVATMGIYFAAREHAVFDPCGWIACFYASFMFCFHNFYMEWPVLTPRILAIVASAFSCLLTPVGLQAVGLWAVSPCRLLATACDVVVIVCTYVFITRGPAAQALDSNSLRDKTYIITGCNTGIGYEIAAALAKAGATIIFACRSEARAQAAMQRLLSEAQGSVAQDQLVFLSLDVSSLESVRQFAASFRATGLGLHALILNAGVMLASRKLSSDGIEMTMASNHLGHFLLVHLLLPDLWLAEKNGDRPRIVVVGSNMGYKHGTFDFSELVACTTDAERGEFLAKPYTMFRAYCQSKLANLCFAAELSRRLRKMDSEIVVRVVHPGEVMTEVMRDMGHVLLSLYGALKPLVYGFLKTAPQGAFCTLYAATAPGLTRAESDSEIFLVRLSPAPLGSAGGDLALADAIWKESHQLTNAPVVL